MNRLILGTVSLALIDDDKAIFNLHSQNLYGRGSRFLNYEALYEALDAVRFSLEETPTIIGIPFRMGSDRAGGDWRIVEKMIEVIFDGSPHEIIIVEYDDI